MEGEYASVDCPLPAGTEAVDKAGGDPGPYRASLAAPLGKAFKRAAAHIAEVRTNRRKKKTTRKPGLCVPFLGSGLHEVARPGFGEQLFVIVTVRRASHISRFSL